MNGILASHWLVVGDMTVPRLVAQESAALIVLAASLLVFRTFRERYLLIWILGWLAYFIFRWTRWEIGAWLLSLSLLLQHLKWAPITDHLPPGFSLMGSMMLGLSMLLVVFDDYKLRTRRLGVVNALTATITRAQQHGPMMATALEELKGLMHASAAWIRLLEGDKMVIAQQIGLSQEYLRERNAVKLDDNLEHVLREGTAKVMKTSAAAEDIQPYLEAERFHHVVLVPLLGKKSAIGILVLGGRHHLSYTHDEIEILTTRDHQLGLAIENLRLVEQILRFQRQWAHTFDSIHDFVLVHDAGFRVVKANRAILQR